MSVIPDVSVVMSVYNGAPHVSATIDSILSQEGVELEFIIVNDGSSDHTVEILNEYARRDSRVRIIHQKNTGLTRALLRGCGVVRGEFIARQDAGDISLPGRLKSQVAALRDQEECVFVSCWTDVVGPNGEYLYTLRGTGVASIPVKILSTQAEWGVLDGPTHHSSVMLRTKEYTRCGGYRPEFHFGQDWDLWYRLAALGTFCVLQRTLCVCRITLESISSLSRLEQERFAQLSKNAMLLRDKGVSDEPILAEARQIVSSLKKRVTRHDKATANYFVGKCLLNNRNDEAIKYLVSALKEDPMYLRAWISLAQSVFSR